MSDRAHWNWDRITYVANALHSSLEVVIIEDESNQLLALGWQLALDGWLVLFLELGLLLYVVVLLQIRVLLVLGLVQAILPLEAGLLLESLHEVDHCFLQRTIGVGVGLSGLTNSAPACMTVVHCSIWAFDELDEVELLGQ
jgi:hypothetical protein